MRYQNMYPFVARYFALSANTLDILFSAGTRIERDKFNEKVCPSCGGEGERVYLRMPPTDPETPNAPLFRFCRACGCTWLVDHREKSMLLLVTIQKFIIED